MSVIRACTRMQNGLVDVGQKLARMDDELARLDDGDFVFCFPWWVLGAFGMNGSRNDVTAVGFFSLSCGLLALLLLRLSTGSRRLAWR
jgi:hypothetical protein